MLTKKKQMFIEYYLKTKNATQSAKQAGYAYRTAYSQGQRLLKNVEVAPVIEERFKALIEELAITKDNIVNRLWKIGNNADRAADKTNALQVLSRLLGFIKESTVQVNVYPKDQLLAVKDIMAKVLDSKRIEG